MKIPFVDLKAQYNSIKNEVDAAIQSVIDETAFIGGKRIQSFEESFAEAQSVKHCIAVANGTDAIYIALKMLGIGRGDEVITVANSWISTSETISQTGAKPVFVDINEYSNIDAEAIDAAITPNTKVIMPVHLYGQPADVDKIRSLCLEKNIFMVEDCAQAHIAELGNQKVGNFGVAGTFSFYPGKNLGAYGDAGAVVTNDDSLAAEMKLFARHGAAKKHNHLIEGINSRMDGIQAAVLSVKLRKLHEWTRARREVAAQYVKLLGDITEIDLPHVANDRTHVYHLFVIRTERRDELREYLGTRGIQTGVHYPTALPFLPAYAYLNHTPADFPRAHEFQERILSLPIFPEMSGRQIEYVAEKIHDFFA